MLSPYVLVFTLLVAAGQPVQSKCEQMAPVPADGKWTRSARQTVAVVLIHGYYFHFVDDTVPRADFRSWQRADSPLVKELARHADVYSFGYGQNADVISIARDSKLREIVTQLKKLGYGDIILVGHSAGGLIARHFVEDHADSGVTRVVQLCSPNAGSPLAGMKGPRSQQSFLDCLTEQGRTRCLQERSAKQIPATVQFLCIVALGDGKSGTDGVVPCVSQWSDDLRKQGIPAAALKGGHRDVVRDIGLAQAVSNLVRQQHPRWSPERIEQARKEILGK